MSKNSRFPISLLSLAMLAASAFADSVTLKTGERIEGTIASETPAEITLNIQISAGIIDQRTVKTADVAKVDRVAPDETAYRLIMKLQPGKSSLQPGQYDALLSTLEAFNTQYPASSHAGEVHAALLAFQAEKKRVDAGEVKLDGLWLSPAEVQKQRVQIGGALAFNAMKTANSAGDPIGALNAFATIEKNFPGAKVMPDAIELARQILTALKPGTERAVQTEKIKNIEREKGFADASPQDRIELTAAFARDQAKADAALAAATAANLWPPFATTSEKCLTAILAKIQSEGPRLNALSVAPMRESLKLAEKAQTEFTNKNFASATETLKEVARLWPANEIGIRLQAQITDAKNPPKPDPKVSPAPTAAVPPATAPATPAPVPATATPAPVVPAPPAAATPAPAPAPAAASAVPDDDETPKPAAPEPPRPFFRTLGGAITIVIALAVLLGVMNIVNKIRARSKETEE